MVNVLFRILLTFNATSLLLIIYFIKEGCTLGDFFYKCPYLLNMHDYISYLTYILLPIFLTWISILLSKRLGKDAFAQGDIINVELANNSFLPSYLGYFFVALSINNIDTLIFVYGILFTFTFFSQALYFNPLFLIFQFDFYNISTKNGSVIFLISRNHYKMPSEIEITEAFRINNYTYIEGTRNEPLDR